MDQTEVYADPPMLIRSMKSGGFIRANDSFRKRVSIHDSELANRHLLDWIEPEDHVNIHSVLDGRKRFSFVRHKTKTEPILLRFNSIEDGDDRIVLMQSADQVRTFDSVRETDDSVEGTLDTLARIIEEQNQEFLCSILLVRDGRFVKGAGPSLPESYNAAIDGHPIGPAVGSCGTAIFWEVPVVVKDIQTDPLWRPFAKLAKEAGVAACWSEPFTCSSGRVLGAVAFYSPEPRSPTEEEMGRLRAAARITGLAVERGYAEEALREQRKRERELEGHLQQAAKMEALGVLAGGVAHDFNNVLMSIVGNAQLALSRTNIDPTVEESLENIVRFSKQAGEFCNQMLAYAGRAQIKKSQIDFGELISESQRLVQAALNKKTELVYSLNDKPISIFGDENQLLQVIMNLITNSAEAMGENEGRIIVSLDVTYCDKATLRTFAQDEMMPTGEYARLTIKDNGVGIEEDAKPRIFDPFFTTKLNGRGLGLAAVKGIVKSHGGAIQLTSRLGAGTKFTVLIPTVQTLEARDFTCGTRVADVSGKHLLLVEDDSRIRQVFRKLLLEIGMSVTEASDGEEAIGIFSKTPDAFDVVLSDLSMPKRDGGEVLHEIRTLRNDIPVIIMSGFNEKEILDRFAKEGLNGAIQKPSPFEELIAKIQSVLA